MAKRESQKSLDSWTKEDWGTKSGKNSTQGKNATGERYLPKKAREHSQIRNMPGALLKNAQQLAKANSSVNNLRILLKRLRSIVVNFITIRTALQIINV